jgi:hypothetical protein
MIDFIGQRRLELSELAAAADVVAADCRFNLWINTLAKGGEISKADLFFLLDLEEQCRNACKAAIARYLSGGSRDDLFGALSIVATRLNGRQLLKSSN